MSDIEIARALEELTDKFSAILGLLKPEELREQIANLEHQATDPDLWSDQARAQQLTGDLSRKKSLLKQLDELKSGLDDLGTLHELALSEADQDAENEVAQELLSMQSRIDALATQTLLSGEFDTSSALLTIRSGAGGDDATDFAEMLLRMYLRYVEKQGGKAKVLDISYAEGAGIKSALVEVDMDFAYGKLSAESGTHRLVRMSPFNAAGKRQTSFAAVEVVPVIEATDEIEIADSDIRVDVFRSSGPGGQSVNTTDSAVRITHLPTGIVVSCQNEKSQLQNKEAAMRVLRSRLLELERQRQAEQRKELAGDVKASWGEQMRSYVLAPYQMVKDLRTEHEENNPDSVFDGEIEGFVNAAIRWRRAGK
jgi:peptide chain release factor 2